MITYKQILIEMINDKIYEKVKTFEKNNNIDTNKCFYSNVCSDDITINKNDNCIYFDKPIEYLFYNNYMTTKIYKCHGLVDKNGMFSIIIE